MSRPALVFVAVLAGCGPVVGMNGDGGMAEATSTASASTGASASDTGPTPDTTSTTALTTFGDDGSTSLDSTSDDATNDDSIFFVKPDFICFAHCPAVECSIWEQDCQEGAKCMPWANDGGDLWTATRCAPLDRTPALVGESCVIQGNSFSGVDDCEEGAMCWGVDPDSLEGECIALCAGPEETPVCPGGRECAVLFDEVVPACVVPCEPLASSCGEGEACVFTGPDSPEVAFACMPTPPFVPGSYGDACESNTLATCDTGLVCMLGTLVPGCEGAECCTLLGDADAPPECPTVNQSCEPLEVGVAEHCACIVPE